MRILGLALLWLGFLWLAETQFSFGVLERIAMDRCAVIEVPVHRTVGLTPVSSLPDTAYSLRNDQARGLAYQGVRIMHGLLPDILWPGVTMLAGGLLLARRDRRDKTPKDSSELAPKP